MSDMVTASYAGEHRDRYGDHWTWDEQTQTAARIEEPWKTMRRSEVERAYGPFDPPLPGGSA